jgi:hypothetical protein
MEDGCRHALDSVVSAFLSESEFARDDTAKPNEAAKEPWQMSRKHFESNYMQHSVLRPESKPEEVEHGIRQDGFSQGIGPNVARPTAGSPTDIMQRNYGTKAGVPVIAVPSLHTQQGGNGARIKQGWKFEGGHIGVPERDYEPLHRIVVRTALAAGKPVPPEVLAEHPDLIAPKPKEFSRSEGACRSMLIAAVHKALNHDGKYTKDSTVEEIPENPSDLDEHTAAVLSAIAEHSSEVKTALEEYLAS